MFKWTAYPFVRISIIWIAGIMASFFLQPNLKISAIICLLCLVFAIFFHYSFNGKFSYRIKSFAGFLLLASLFFGGVWRTHQVDPLHDPTHISRSLETGKACYYTGKVAGEVERAGKFDRAVIETTSRKSASEWVPASGKVLLYADTTLELRFGDRILIKGAPQNIPGPANPGEFDYRRYLKYQQIHVRQFVSDPSHIRKIAQIDHFSLKKSIIAFRDNARTLIKTHVKGEQEQAVVQALLLGMKEDLGDNLKDAYSAAGAMHVLAVSGLHVGIIYGFFYFLLKGMRRRKYGRILFAALNLLILWTYAAVTGFAPSTIRAVIMFSAVIVGQAFNVRSTIYNSIFFSAFIILLWNPYMLMNVGFQLSYLAVLGIVYLTPKFYHALTFRNGIADKIWMLTSVSIAAQIATFPATVFYFNQFPAYFLLANLVVVPGAFLILALGLVFLFLAFIPPVAHLLGTLLDALVCSMNGLILWIERLPGSVVYPLSISAAEAALLYAGVFFILVLFYERKFRYATAAFCCLALFSISKISDRVLDNSHQKIIFYSMQRSLAVDFIDGRKAVLYAEDSLDPNELEYRIAPCRIQFGLSPAPEGDLRILKPNEIKNITFGERRIVFLAKPLSGFAVLEREDVEVLVASGNAVKDLQPLLDHFEFDELIIASGYAPWLAARLIEQAEKAGVACHWLRSDGAKIIEL